RGLAPDRRRTLALSSLCRIGGAHRRPCWLSVGSGAVSVHAQPSRQRPARVDRPDFGHRKWRPLAVYGNPEEHGFRAVGIMDTRRHYHLAHEGCHLRRAAGRDRADVAGTRQYLARSGHARLRAKSGSRHADGGQDGDVAGRRQRLLVRARGYRRGTLCRHLFTRALHGRLVHSQGRGGRHPGRRRQLGRRTRRRHQPWHHRVDRCVVPAHSLPRRLRSGVSGGDFAVPPARAVRGPEMSAVWLLVPLYMVPLVSHNEVLLTILIFTYILGILAIGFNIVFGYAGQLTMFHGAAFGIGGYATFLILTKFGVSFWLALLPMFAGILVLSLLVGWICFKFRLREFYF